MGKWLAALWLAWAPLAWGEGIVEVLNRSHAQRLATLSDAHHGQPSAEAVRRIAHSYQVLIDQLGFVQPVSLRVVRSEAVAETLQGRVLVVDERLAELPEGERLFVLAHELGHIALGHWAQLGQLYQRHIPDEVLRSRTDAIAALLGREASAMAHAHEFAADAYGLAALRRLGRGPEDVMGLFTRFGPTRDTPTHPGTRKRVAQLRALEARDME